MNTLHAMDLERTIRMLLKMHAHELGIEGTVEFLENVVAEYRHKDQEPRIPDHFDDTPQGVDMTHDPDRI